MKALLLLTLILLAGCKGDQPPKGMKLVGTMSIYITERGALTVVHDQTNEAMMIEWNINRILVKQKKEAAPSK
jgi:hypothetical protein